MYVRVIYYFFCNESVKFVIVKPARLDLINQEPYRMRGAKHNMLKKCDFGSGRKPLGS